MSSGYNIAMRVFGTFSWVIFPAILCCAWSPRAVLGERVIYVHAVAPGGNDGTSWKDAYVDLQDALAVAQPGDEIWVAAGIYTPDRGTGDRSATFELVSGVGMYGGFAGWETRRNQTGRSG